MTDPAIEPIKLGIVGLGGFAQLMHLRLLADLAEFEIVAVCDDSARVVEAIADRYRVPGRHATLDEFLAHPGLDAVLVANRDHYETVAGALRARKHVLVEKPLVFDPAEGRELIELAQAVGVTAMVGYMKRYDWGYQQAIERIPQIEPQMVRVHDFKCQIHLHYGLYDLVRRSDIPVETKQAEEVQIMDRLAAGLGGAGDPALYRMLLFFASHDLNLLRGAAGEVDEVLSVHAPSNQAVVAVVDQGLPGPSILQLCTSTDYGWFEEELLVAGADKMLTLRLPHPYVHYAQAQVTARSHDGQATQDARGEGPPLDSFRRMWLAFADGIRGGATPVTTFEDSVRDLEFAIQLVHQVARNRAA